MADTAGKLELLKKRLAELQPGLVAVSGGLDSRVLASLAWGWNLDFTPVHVFGPHVPLEATRGVEKWLVSAGREPLMLEVDPLTLPEVAGNSRERCYHCKRAIFTAILMAAAVRGHSRVIEGTQASDAGAYRPGRKALQELGIVSPLAEAGLTKPELRDIARQKGIPDPDQVARPCLLTRFEYGLHADADLLRRLARAEAALAALGLIDFRIRIHADGRTVLQVAKDQPMDAAAAQQLLTDYGFKAVEIVASATVSGYFDT